MTRRDHVALVTGALGGIGDALCRGLDKRGYAVVVHDIGDPSRGAAFARELGDASYIGGDIADASVSRTLVDRALDRWGRLDVVVNNAAIAQQIPHRELDGVTEEFWHRVLGVNLLGPWHLAKAAAPALRAAGGSIVNVASVAGLTVSGSSIPYAVSKAGLVHLTKLLAAALAPEIRVNAIAPGYIDTPLTHGWDTLRDSVLERAPLARLGTPDDAAACAFALLDSPYTTGAVLTVDGGLHLM